MKTKQTTLPQNLGGRNTKKQRPRIQITVEVLKRLESEFDVSGNTIRWALKLFSDSKTSKNIRARAMEMMAETIIKNTELINEYDND